MSNSGPILVDWFDAGYGNPLLDVVQTHILLEFGLSGKVDDKLRNEFLQTYRLLSYRSWSADTDWLERLRLPIILARMTEPISAEERSSLLLCLNKLLSGL